jgi:hypothetical protein
MFGMNCRQGCELLNSAFVTCSDSSRRRCTRGYFAAALLMATFIASPIVAGVLDIPFDFSRGDIGLDAKVKETPVFLLLDTGVDPSLVDRTRAESLGLKIDLRAGGEASGYGDDKSAAIFPAILDGLSIGGHSFGPIDALVADTGAMSRALGREVDGVLGYSFLKDKIVLIDYDSKKVAILDKQTDAEPTLRSCHKSWSIALRFLDGDNTPIIGSFRLGPASGPVTLDTGSNGGISLFDRALALSGVTAVLSEHGELEHTGARGVAKSTTYLLGAPVGFGPFSLPAGQIVNRIHAPGTADKRLANIGNRLFAEMKLKILLDYRAKRLAFYGDCRTSTVER